MRSPAFLCLLLPALSTSCVIELGDWGGVKSSKDVELAFTPGAAMTEILVDTYNGAITIEASEAASVSGTSKIWASSNTQEGADVRVNSMSWTFTEEANGRVVLKLGRPVTGGSNNAGGSAVLKVPTGARVLVDTGNGAVEIHGSFPYVWVDTSNGAVKVHGAKDVEADTSNGAVEVKADGKVLIDTSNGRVTYTGSSTDFEIDSSNGAIVIDLIGDWSGKGRVDTSNGAITVNCAGTLRCSIQSHTGNGKLHLEGPQIAGGTGSLSLDSGNGSIWVKHGAK